MYSEKVQDLLKKKKIKIGDRVVVKKLGRKTEGVLMQQTSAGDPETLVVKMDSGYNIGIKLKNAGVEKSRSKAKPPSVKPRKLKFDPRKPGISVLSVGGTITSKVDYKTGGVTTLSSPEEILMNVPEITKIVNVKNMSMPFTIMSENMNHTHWQVLAKACAQELNKKDIKGVIVTHGTDILHFTSAALSFMLRGLGKPVVVTGSQRSTDRGSSDGGMNLVCSAHTAVSDIAEVGICMHGQINDDHCIFSRGSKVRKMSTQRRDAFRPINEYPLAKVWPDGKMVIKNRNFRKRNDKARVQVDAAFESKVALLPTYPGSDPTVMEYLIKKGYKGFIVQATGLGQIPMKTNSWLPIIKRTVDSGIPVFFTAETIYGRLNQNVYSEGRAALETGGIPLGDMLSETAYVKLGWVLGHTKDPKKVKEMMLRDYAGEISKRTLVGTFLY